MRDAKMALWIIGWVCTLMLAHAAFRPLLGG